MERVRLEKKVVRKKGVRAKLDTKYLLVHPELGVFIGFADNTFYWSNLDSGGNTNALLLTEERLRQPFIKHMIGFMSKHFPGSYFTKPCKVDPSVNYLTMEQCEEIGIPKWSRFENTYFSKHFH